VISDPLTDASLPAEEVPLAELPIEPADPEDDPAYRVFIDSLFYLPPEEIALVREAYLFGEQAHRGQKRLSGEPYITHPLAVAGAIAEWQMDVEGVVAALLHDVMEDTSVGKTEIAERFGSRSPNWSTASRSWTRSSSSRRKRRRPRTSARC
jgi:guanosine-3',5'-bis(diphosphate) 3'-pyrophosphohydrolase